MDNAKKLLRCVILTFGFRVFYFVVSAIMLSVVTIASNFLDKDNFLQIGQQALGIVVTVFVKVEPIVITAFALYFVANFSKPRVKGIEVLIFTLLWFVSGIFMGYGTRNAPTTILIHSIIPETIGVLLVVLLKRKNIQSYI